MNRVDDFISYVQELGITLWTEDGRLYYRAPKGIVTSEIRAQISEFKAEMIRVLQKESLYSSIPDPIEPVVRTGDPALSFAQERLWFLYKLEGGSATYNIPAAFRLTGPLKADILFRSLNEIIRRHETLRTGFAMQDGRPVQVIAPYQVLPIPAVDLQALAEAAQSSEIERLTTQEVRRPFDLEKQPLLRVKLLCLEPEVHVLLLTVHHIVFDGWSAEVFVRELVLLYASFLKGETATLPELSIQYADFAHWQRQRLKGVVLETQLEYWKKQLAGAPPVLDLPMDRPRPSFVTFKGAAVRINLEAELKERLQAISRESNASLFMTLLTALGILLNRYSHQQDIVIGSPIAGRIRKETEALIGFFVNTLVLRMDLSGTPSFRDLLGRVRRMALDAYTHQDVPFEQLVEVLQPERHLSYNPLFQVMFVLQNTPMRAFTCPGLTISLLDIEGLTALFDLTLSMIETEQALTGVLVYNTDLFNKNTMVRMAEHLQILVQGIAENPDRPVCELPFLGEWEKRLLLSQWNETERPYPRDKNIHQLFEEQVERRPEAAAVVYESQTLTYFELNRRANQLAHALREQGVSPEKSVVLCLERSLEMVIGLLGILKAGGIYVPLDPASYPMERLTFILEDIRPTIILTQESFVPLLPLTQTTIICLNQAENSCFLNTNLEQQISADNLAYVSYTSGSTGIPKGVLVPHRGVIRLVKEANYAELNAEQIFLHLAPLMFDASTLELWGSLLNGARLVVFPAGWFSLDALGEVIEREKVSLLWLTAGLFHQMVEQELPKLQKVKQILAGGDVLSASHVRQVLKNKQEDCLINGYGPTENTTFTCCYSVKDEKAVGAVVAIGRPIANTRVYILDQQMQLAGIGVPGELYAGGDGLARGYLNRPELTAEKFIPDMFSVKPGERLYRTGDLARYRSDGNIEFLGRIDHQVKIRGYRIELGEIEAVLSRHPAVKENTVMVQENKSGDKRLVAYIVPRHATHSIPDLKQSLQNSLPGYMVPSAFVLLKALPLTPNGKIDRQALPAPDDTRSGIEKEYVAPRTLPEKEMAEIWRKVLGVERISIHDNFFELGGNSISAIRLFAYIKEKWGVLIPVATIFQVPTIKVLSLFVRKDDQKSEWSHLVPIRKTGNRSPLYCIHPVTGTVLCYADLVRYLPDEQPVYALQAKGFQKGETPHRNVVELAKDYLDAVYALQPEGPYYFCGWSAGGIFAYEMAQQVLAANKKMGQLVLIDTNPLVYTGHKNTNKVIASAILLIYGLTQAFIHLKELLTAIDFQSLGISGLIRRTKTVMQINSLWMTYDIKPYREKIILFQTDQGEKIMKANPKNSIERYAAGGLEIIKLPGEHLMIVYEPIVRLLAAHLQRLLTMKPNR